MKIVIISIVLVPLLMQCMEHTDISKKEEQEVAKKAPENSARTGIPFDFALEIPQMDDTTLAAFLEKNDVVVNGLRGQELIKTIRQCNDESERFAIGLEIIEQCDKKKTEQVLSFFH